MVAPRDLRAGGTWLGLSKTGVFAALTNRPTEHLEPERRSRGLLLADVLGEPSAVRAARALSSLPASAYNPFNLFLSDGRRAFAAVYEEKPRVTELAVGAHVLGNADPDDRGVPKVARLLREAEAVANATSRDLLENLAALCRSHGGGGGALEDTCIHAGGYGTRSSTLLLRGAAVETSVLRFADGPPCETEYRDWTPLLGALSGRSGATARSSA